MTERWGLVNEKKVSSSGRGHRAKKKNHAPTSNRGDRVLLSSIPVPRYGLVMQEERGIAMGQVEGGRKRGRVGMRGWREVGRKERNEKRVWATDPFSL